MRRLSLFLLVSLLGCRECVGAKADAELLPELNDILANIADEDEYTEWQSALYEFEKTARIYRRPDLGNRIAKLSFQAEMARLPESLCSSLQVARWIRAHLTRIRSSFEGLETTTVEPVLCGTTPRPLRRGLDDAWIIHGLDLDADPSRLRLVVSSTTGSTDRSTYLSVRSPVRATVALTGPLAVPTGAQDHELALMWGDKVLSRVPLTGAQPAIRVTMTESRSRPASSPTTTATIPAGHVLIGGGCRARRVGTAQLLTASYPSGPTTWTCSSKDTLTQAESTVRAYALSIPARLGVETRVVTNTSPRGGHVQTLAILPAGYQLIGGGCLLAWTSTPSSHLLTVSEPAARSFQCQAKDNVVKSDATLRAYAIGIAEDAPFRVVRNDATGVLGFRGHISASLTDPEAELVGGGCMVASQGLHGNLLSASYPRLDERRWVCAHADHKNPDKGTPRAFALGLRAN